MDSSIPDQRSGRRQRSARDLTVVIDTVGFLRALLNPLGAWGAVIFDHRDKYEPIVSEQLLAEVADVLWRPQLTRKFSGHHGRDVHAVNELLAAGRQVTLDVIVRVSRDPNDDYLIAMAVKGGAKFLVSEDKDILSIGAYRGIAFIDGRQFIEYLKALDRQ